VLLADLHQGVSLNQLIEIVNELNGIGCALLLLLCFQSELLSTSTMLAALIGGRPGRRPSASWTTCSVSCAYCSSRPSPIFISPRLVGQPIEARNTSKRLMPSMATAVSSVPLRGIEKMRLANWAKTGRTVAGGEAHPCRVDGGEASAVSDVVVGGYGVFNHVHRKGRGRAGLHPSVQCYQRCPLYLFAGLEVVSIGYCFRAPFHGGENDSFGKPILKGVPSIPLKYDSVTCVMRSHMPYAVWSIGTLTVNSGSTTAAFG